MKHSIKLAVRYTDVASGNQHDLPAIYVKNGILASHLRYLSWYSEKSDSWRERSVFSIRLLIDYIESFPNHRSATTILKSFTETLITGSVNYDSYVDRLGLYWPPRDLAAANNILFHISHYTDFLTWQDGYEQARINPFRQATRWEERMNWCAYYHKHANVFLNHLSSWSDAKKEATRKRLIYTPPELLISNDKVERFPEEYIEQLIWDGFVDNGKPNYRAQAITMLLNFGGLRKSEVFHIYTSDITINPNHPGEALVRVYHPVYGKSPDPRYKNRQQYLQFETNYKPRNAYRITERLHAGWKNPLLTSRQGFFEVVFSPPGKAKEFLRLWANYLKYQRVEPKDAHPFAFTNVRGAPETVKNFQRQHKKAVENIGLKCKKEFGTTEHGHRHAYGYRLRRLGFGQIEIQKAMHHKSETSCLVYIKPSNDDIRNKMKIYENE